MRLKGIGEVGSSWEGIEVSDDVLKMVVIVENKWQPAHQQKVKFSFKNS